MKKLIALFIILVLCLPLVACYTPEENDVKAYSFSVDYDYGMHIQGKATPLLDGSKLFFEPQDWNIDTLVGGDVITMVYTGELLIQESYPSQVATHHLDIAGISATKAELLELEVIMCEDNSPMIRAKNESLANHTVTLKSSYIIDEDLSYHELSASDVGKTVWGSYVNSDETSEIEIISLYSYNPRSLSDGDDFHEHVPFDAMLNLEIIAGEFRFQRIATTPCIVYSNTSINEMSSGVIFEDRYDILNAIFKVMDGKDAIMDAPECVFSHYIYMFDNTDESTPWHYRFAICDCGTVLITNNDEFLCAIKISEDEIQSVLNALK